MPQHVTLRTELREEDLLLMIRWMSNEHVSRFLNEHQSITSQLKQVYDARLPVFAPLFNRGGRFFMLCTGREQPIGFLRMADMPGNAAELVIAVGEESMWGQGYGSADLAEALKAAFFELRKELIIAHIHNANDRSRRLFTGYGFAPCAEGREMTRYRLSLDGYLHPERLRQSDIA